MKSIKSMMMAVGCLALATVAYVASASPLLAIGFALSAAFALFAPEPFRPFQGTPRSIFETRRLGLA